MWNSNVFGGGSGNPGGFGNKSAGGFMNSDIGSPAGASQDKKKSERINNVVPCTIAHIMQNAESGEHMKVGSMVAHMITIVGMVRSIDQQSTRVTYFVDDKTTAPIEVQMWLGENDEYGAEKRSSIVENTYIRVIGVLRSIKGKRLINAFKIVPVTDMNELSMHFLEVIHTSMAVAVMDNKSPGNMSSLSSTATVKSEFGSGMNTSFGFGGGNQTSAGFGLNKTQQIVLQAISSSTSEKGVNYDFLFSTIKSLNPQTIRETVDFLSNEGHIYSTIDDDHFKTTDSGCF